MCISPSLNTVSVVLDVCDESNLQKWYNIDGTLQSFENEQLCLDVQSGDAGTPLISAQCDGSASQFWARTNITGLINHRYDTSMMVEGCDTLTNNTVVLVKKSWLKGTYNYLSSLYYICSI